MNIGDLPFIHFLTKTQDARGVSLLTPLEAEISQAGIFAAPLINGSMHPAYRFHFSIYRGDGEFAEDARGNRELFTGVAMKFRQYRRDVLTLTFPAGGLNLGLQLPSYLEAHGRLIAPIFRRVLRRGEVRYRGHFAHPDFNSPFAELEHDPSVLDEILDKFGFSLIGCDPHTGYTRRELS